MENLTNDAKFLLSSMYKAYLDRRKSGQLKKDAVYFDNLEAVHSEIMPEWPIEDVKSTCHELIKHDLLKGKPASTTIWFISLTTEAVALLETTFKDKVGSVLDYAAKVKSAIPFI